jgi:hypothetical protein
MAVRLVQQIQAEDYWQNKAKLVAARDNYPKNSIHVAALKMLVRRDLI